MPVAAFCPSLVPTMALWRLMTPTLAGSSANAGSASANPTIGNKNDVLFTTDSLQNSILRRAKRGLLRRGRRFGSRGRGLRSGRLLHCRRPSGRFGRRRGLDIKLDGHPGDVVGI